MAHQADQQTVNTAQRTHIVTDLEKVDGITDNREEILPDSNVRLACTVSNCLQILGKLLHERNDSRQQRICTTTTTIIIIIIMVVTRRFNMA